jgi:DNA-binding NarL/FixJ family response regulator
MAIKVFLADDHKLFREGLRALLEKEQDMKVIGEAEDGRTTVQLMRELAPDVVIMDVAMPDLNGVEACRKIIAQFPHVKVLGLSMHSDKRFVAEMLRAGASGYLLKDCALDELVGAIRAVARNQTYLSPRIAGVVVRDYVERLSKKAPSQAPELTPTEREVLQLLAEGKSTKVAAQTLHVTVKTIETHRQHIMAKLGIDSIAELTKYAIREGLTSLEG